MTSSAISSPNRDAEEEPSIRRLLFVVDAAVADIAEPPPAVRAIIDAAGEVCVITPTLPGRLAWLADDVDGFRRVADDRLDTVLGHMRSIGANVNADTLRGSILTVIADGVVAFRPDHVLLALRSADHANWQERGLVEHVEARFDLPVTSYSVDVEGRASDADGPLLLCYDGSDGASHAIDRAGALFSGKGALVLAVWQSTAGSASFDWAGATAGTVDFSELAGAAADQGSRVAAAGVVIAKAAGLNAAPLAVEAAGPVWRTILEVAARHDAATIVMGSRGLTGLRSKLRGTVSSAVVHHADRPTLIVSDATLVAEALELSQRAHA